MGNLGRPKVSLPSAHREGLGTSRSARKSGARPRETYPQLTEKTLDILEAVGALRRPSMQQIQQRCRLPTTTLHRIMQSLLRRGFVMHAGKTTYQLGTSLIALADGLSIRELLPAAARLPLELVSKQTRSHAHLGIWEDGMVTYLIKQQYGKTRLHSAEGMQLEAYCSAIGKILLAAASEDEFEAYIAEGAFVPLTVNTIVDADRLRSEVEHVRDCGWATDEEEIALGLRCVAVPVVDNSGKTIAAVSVSSVCSGRGPDLDLCLPLLREAAQTINQNLFPLS